MTLPAFSFENYATSRDASRHQDTADLWGAVCARGDWLAYNRSQAGCTARGADDPVTSMVAGSAYDFGKIYLPPVGSSGGVVRVYIRHSGTNVSFRAVKSIRREDGGVTSGPSGTAISTGPDAAGWLSGDVTIPDDGRAVLRIVAECTGDTNEIPGSIVVLTKAEATMADGATPPSSWPKLSLARMGTAYRPDGAATLRLLKQQGDYIAAKTPRVLHAHRIGPAGVTRFLLAANDSDSVVARYKVPRGPLVGACTLYVYAYQDDTSIAHGGAAVRVYVNDDAEGSSPAATIYIASRIRLLLASGSVGATFSGPLVPGSPVTVTVTASGGDTATAAALATAISSNMALASILTATHDGNKVIIEPLVEGIAIAPTGTGALVEAQPAQRYSVTVPSGSWTANSVHDVKVRGFAGRKSDGTANGRITVPAVALHEDAHSTSGYLVGGDLTPTEWTARAWNAPRHGSPIVASYAGTDLTKRYTDRIRTAKSLLLSGMRHAVLIEDSLFRNDAGDLLASTKASNTAADQLFVGVRKPSYGVATVDVWGFVRRSGVTGADSAIYPRFSVWLDDTEVDGANVTLGATPDDLLPRWIRIARVGVTANTLTQIEVKAGFVTRNGTGSAAANDAAVLDGVRIIEIPDDAPPS
jgi:hypothetical protein